MGVPGFFMWLTRSYPKTSRNAVVVNEPAENPNPNGMEFDNLYIDMNGVIHPCCHPEEGEQPASEAEMVERICAFVERMFCIVRPRKVLYLAIDGVAPRAKMNQQRARRFLSALIARRSAATRKTFDDNGEDRPKESAPHFDSNVITPGTEFMDMVAMELGKWVARKVETDAAWKTVSVIVTSSEVPGEGEHKVIDFIRRQRAATGYDPQTRHCIVGLDADLIMLALATHEPHFYVLREAGKGTRCARCGHTGHAMRDCSASNEQIAAECAARRNGVTQVDVDYIFLQVPVLREYLADTFASLSQSVGWFDLDRAIDDFVFLCFFVGNDFLPRNPVLDVYKGAVADLLSIYVSILPSLGGFIVRDGNLDIGRCLVVLAEVAKIESSLSRSVGRETRISRIGKTATATATATEPNGDRVRMGTDGWEDRYYEAKFGKPRNEELLAPLCRSYMEGLCWVLRYYYQDCPSWKWYYPYNYAPLACDIIKYVDPAVLGDPKFELGQPFTPFEQLMGVLPSSSRGCLPKKLHWLMRSKRSPIADFYPEEFSVDTNGQLLDPKFAHRGVVLLPFIDEERLLAAMKGRDETYTADEHRRNRRRGDALVICNSRSALAKAIRESPQRPRAKELSHGLFGAVRPIDAAPAIGEGVGLVAAFDEPTLAEGQSYSYSLLPGVKLPRSVLGSTYRPPAVKPQVKLTQVQRDAAAAREQSRGMRQASHMQARGLVAPPTVAAKAAATRPPVVKASARPPSTQLARAAKKTYFDD